MSKLKSVAYLLATFTSIAFSAVAHADHSWNNYHWARTTNSFTLQLVDSVTTDWDFQLGESLTRWSQPTVLDANITSSD